MLDMGQAEQQVNVYDFVKRMRQRRIHSVQVQVIFHTITIILKAASFMALHNDPSLSNGVWSYLILLWGNMYNSFDRNFERMLLSNYLVYF